tara:strand:- start:687 stop:1070 length:384 start_codon:yes stop_codon:yes gene_type:complete
MLKGKKSGMECQPLQIVFVPEMSVQITLAIIHVSNNWMRNMFQMSTYLVQASRLWGYLYKGIPLKGTASPIDALCGNPGTFRFRRYRVVDFPLVGSKPTNKGEVSLHNLTVSKGCIQSLIGGFATGK